MRIHLSFEQLVRLSGIRLKSETLSVVDYITQSRPGCVSLPILSDGMWVTGTAVTGFCGLESLLFRIVFSAISEFFPILVKESYMIFVDRSGCRLDIKDAKLSWVFRQLNIL